MRRFYHILCLLFLSSCILNTYAQNHYDVGQYVAFKPFINPAASGEYNSFSAALLARQQWTGWPKAPRLFKFNLVIPFKRNSIGFNYTEYSINIHRNQEIMGTYSHSIHFANKNKLHLGLSGGITVNESNYTLVETQETDTEFSVNEQLLIPQASLGIYFTSRSFYTGLSVPSVMYQSEQKPETYEFDIQNLHYYFLAGTSVPLGNNFNLDFSTFAKVTKNVPVDFDLNMMMNYLDIFAIGASYRYEKEMLLMTNIQITKSIKLGYSFHGYFQVSGTNLLGHELMLIYNFQKKEPVKIQSPRI